MKPSFPTYRASLTTELRNPLPSYFDPRKYLRVDFRYKLVNVKHPSSCHSRPRLSPGLWKTTLLSHLLWQANADKDAGRRSATYRAPSWSWASVECPVRYIPGRIESNMVTVVDANIQTRVENIQWGKVSGSLLSSAPGENLPRSQWNIRPINYFPKRPRLLREASCTLSIEFSGSVDRSLRLPRQERKRAWSRARRERDEVVRRYDRERLKKEDERAQADEAVESV